jgi:hypothetical protein
MYERIKDMRFALRDLSVLAYAQGFTLWHYRVGNVDMVAGAGFFDDAADMIASGDMLLVSSPLGGRILTAISEAGSVRTAPMM